MRRWKKVVDAKTKDGAFVFHDPKLDADLNLVFDQIKIVRGMEGYGWFANVIFHDKDEPKKQYAIDFWFKPDGDQLKLMDIRVQKGPKQEGDGYVMITRLPVAWWWLPLPGAPGRHGGDACMAGDEASTPILPPTRTQDSHLTSRTTRPARRCHWTSWRSVAGAT